MLEETSHTKLLECNWQSETVGIAVTLQVLLSEVTLFVSISEYLVRRFKQTTTVYFHIPH
jgi:hypothetical protein